MAQEGKKILYLGDDTAYCKVLAAEFQRLYPGIKFEQFSESTPERIQSLVIKVAQSNPSLVFVDFSKHTDDYNHLARVLVRSNRTKPMPVVGLHDYLSPPEQIKEGFLAGVKLNHIKSAEVFDVVFGAMNLVTPGEAKEHGFATAKFEQEITAQHLVKVGFIQNKGLHFESDINFQNGEELRLKHHWTQKKMIPSTLVKVKKTSRSLLFYSNYALDVDFAWVDPVIKAEGDSEERTNELVQERDHNVTKAKKALEAWLDDNTDRSQKKSVRVLIVDRMLGIYDNRSRADKYGYAIRCQPFINDPAAELDAQRPQVIAFTLDVPPEDGQDAPQPPLNDLAMLQKLIQILTNKLTDISPYIVVFNATSSSKELQASMKYPQLMAYSGQFSPETLLKMASMFEQKLKIDKEQAMSMDTVTQVFIKKSSPMSIAEVEEAINLTQISETDAVFTCQRPLPDGATLRVETPFVGYLTVTAHPQLGKAPAYYALINGLGENEKKSLRRYVNSIFFKDHDAAKLAELENFQTLNQAKWQDMLNQQKAKLEAEEKAKKEAEEKKKAEEEAAKAKAEEPPAES